MSEDPIGFIAGDTTLSRYLSNNPTNATDPMGLQEYGPAKPPGWEPPTIEIPKGFERYGRDGKLAREYWPDGAVELKSVNQATIQVVPIDAHEEANTSFLLSPIWWSGAYCADPLKPTDAHVMVDLIKSRLGPKGKVGNLVIRTHGSKGSVLLGIARGADGNFVWSSINNIKLDPDSPYYDARLVEKLKELRPHFREDSKVTIWACEVAGNAEGRALLQRLANILNVEVEAPDTGTGTAYFMQWRTTWWYAKPGGIVPPSGNNTSSDSKKN
jgi:hypothetical protein